MKNNYTFLWDILKKDKLISGEMPMENNNSPWFIRVLLGVAGWLGALFLLFFVVISMDFLIQNSLSAIIGGLILCVFAYFIFKKKITNDFVIQFVFSLSLVGQGLIYFGIIDAFSSNERLVALFILVINILFFILFNHFLLKTLAALMGMYSLIFFISTFGLYPYVPMLLFASLSFIWLYEYKSPVKPIYTQSIGVALTLLAVLSVLIYDSQWVGILFDFYNDFVTPFAENISVWINTAIAGIILIWIGFSLFNKSKILVVTVALLLAGTEYFAPGFPIIISIIILGFAHGNFLLFISGLLSTLIYMSYYYYKMDISLLHKSKN